MKSENLIKTAFEKSIIFKWELHRFFFYTCPSWKNSLANIYETSTLKKVRTLKYHQTFAKTNQFIYLAFNCFMQIINLNITLVKFAWTSVEVNITIKVSIEVSTQLTITWPKIQKGIPQVFFEKAVLNKLYKIYQKKPVLESTS